MPLEGDLYRRRLRGQSAIRKAVRLPRANARSVAPRRCWDGASRPAPSHRTARDSVLIADQGPLDRRVCAAGSRRIPSHRDRGLVALPVPHGRSRHTRPDGRTDVTGIPNLHEAKAHRAGTPEEASMPTYLSPGVYVEEVEAGSRPIEGVGTAVAAFIGLAERGPLNTPTLVSNWTQFTSTFGDFVPGGYLAHAVYGYIHERRRQLLRRPDRRRGRQRVRPQAASDAACGTAGRAAPSASRYRAVAGDASVGHRQQRRRRAPKPVSVEVADPVATAWARRHVHLKVLVDGQVWVEEFDERHAEEDVATSSRGPAASKLIRIEETAPAPRTRRPGRGRAAAPAARAGRRAAGRADRRRLRRRRRRAHRLRRAGGRRRDHHGLRPRPDERLPAGRDRPGDRARPSSSA